MLPGKWAVDEAGRVDFLCSVAAGVEVETRIQNLGSEKVALAVRFSSHSALREEAEWHEGERLELEAGRAATCTFIEDAGSSTQLDEDASEDVFWCRGEA